MAHTADNTLKVEEQKVNIVKNITNKFMERIMKGFIILFAVLILSFSDSTAQFHGYSSGSNAYGQLGTNSSNIKEENFRHISLSQKWKAISSGNKFSVAIAEDGTLWAWGINDRFQLGDNTIIQKSEPVQISNYTNWIKISCGEKYTLALRRDSTLWAWGDNAYGQLGDGTISSKAEPTQIGLAKWLFIDAGSKHSLGIKSDGTLWAWGDNANGQLGDGTQVAKLSPVQISPLSGWKSISAGYDFSVSILRTANAGGTPATLNALYAWGKNSVHQLGNENTTALSIPTRIGNAVNWDSVVAGYEYCLTLKTDSTLWAWGANTSGQLGNNGGESYELIPVQIGTDKWSKISAYHEHSLGIKPDGTLWGWGRNTYGQLGLGSNTWNPTIPMQIGELSGWRIASAGDNMSIALRESSMISKPTLRDPGYDYPDAKSLISFRWIPVATATEYEIQISQFSNFDPSKLFVNTSVRETYYTTNGFEANTVYYWRVKAKNDLEESPWSESGTFTTEEFTIEQAWGHFANTGLSASIGFAINGTYLIDNQLIQNGDVIGAFYTDGSVNKCAGYLVWDGSTMGFTVWGDDELTANIKEGFAAGEKYTFKIYQVATEKIFPIEVRYESGPYSSEVFSNNGISKITSFTASSAASQNIQLVNGWNMVSSYIKPTSNTFSNIVTIANNPIIYAKNFVGQTYWPNYLTNLDTWNERDAYVIKTNDDCTMKLSGTQLMPEDNPINLKGRGWKWIPYYRETPMSPSQALADLNGSYMLVKSSDGKVYWPQNVYSLTNLEPGKGYMVYMNKTATLTYPKNKVMYGKVKAMDALISDSEPKTLVPNYQNTGASAVLSINIDGAKAGDEIGVFSADGQIVGSAVYSTNNAGIVIWGDDFLTAQKDGASENEELKIKLYRSESNTYADIELSQILEKTTVSELISLNYKTNAIFTAIGKIGTSGIANELQQTVRVSPQPASDEAIIDFPNGVNSSAIVSVYSSNGELISQSTLDNLSNGFNRIKLNVSGYNSGIYRVVIQSENESIQTNIIVVR